MRDKIVIYDDENVFELDLSNVKFTDQEENPRFQDSFSIKFTFPFEFHLDRDLRVKLGDFSSMNSINLKTYYDNCYHINDGRIKKARLQILGSIGEIVKAQLDSGFEQLPNWDKKLRDLPLEIVTSETTDMISVAQTVVSQTFPTVNYNFPMIHTDIYDGVPMFDDFQGTLNKRDENGVFVVNTSNPTVNDYFNRNIVVPMPYAMHILKAGFEDAGMTLHGEILTDELINKIIMIPTKRIELFDRPEFVEWLVGYESFTEAHNIPGIGVIGLYQSIQPIELHGKFRISGSGTFGRRNYTIGESGRPKIYFNDELVFSFNQLRGNFEFDFIVETIPGIDNELKFTCFDFENLEVNRIEAYIFPLELWDENGERILEMADITEMHLGELLPDLTFGDFVTFLENLFNLEKRIENGNEVWINRIDSAFENSSFKDLSEYEILNPEKQFNTALSFLLSYANIENESFPLDKVYYDINGMATENYVEKENTNSIEINAIPLPSFSRDTFRSAYQFFDEESVFQMALYDGLQYGINRTLENNDLLLPVIFNQRWQKWLQFRIHATTIKWRFQILKNKWRNIHILDNIYAYNNKLWIKSINKTSVNEKIYEIELEANIVRN